MPFHFQTFKVRAITALVFVAVMLTGILYNQWSFLLLIGIIHFGCWIEYKKLIDLIDPAYSSISSLHSNMVMLIGGCFVLLNTQPDYLKVGNIALSAIGWYGIMLLTIVFCAKEIVFKKIIDLKSIGYSVFGWCYISLSWGLLIKLRSLNLFFTTKQGQYIDLGWLFPIILIASIWINDTMQYLVGSFFGKTPFSKISPKKTWEGTVGGSALAIVTVGLFDSMYLGLPMATSFVIPIIAAVIGTLGDLLESKLKRMANVKDSGQIMPGHGGFLDRFDSILLAAPFVWLFVYFAYSY